MRCVFPARRWRPLARSTRPRHEHATHVSTIAHTDRDDHAGRRTLRDRRAPSRRVTIPLTNFHGQHENPEPAAGRSASAWPMPPPPRAGRGRALRPRRRSSPMKVIASRIEGEPHDSNRPTSSGAMGLPPMAAQPITGHASRRSPGKDGQPLTRDGKSAAGFRRSGVVGRSGDPYCLGGSSAAAESDASFCLGGSPHVD